MTTGEVLAATNQRDGAADAFTDAIRSAEHHRLPHQIQRSIRATVKTGMHELTADAQAALQRIRALLAR
ncbi:hypothetical protein IU485_16110 [Nocardia cyriacigeorgica]|uniref:hypothetical protein n=1 Tax=Nocardia cyriacigeorgica TaxID=135487 RepID=UPI00189422E2|nr:hypothetical protein [Nocardia cyriacigeorgica]MBF6082889.1 hypothetical protein [Nocardia cyriacigeorgica]